MTWCRRLRLGACRGVTLAAVASTAAGAVTSTDGTADASTLANAAVCVVGSVRPALGERGTGSGVDYAAYARVLETHVDDRGRVNYAHLAAHRLELDAFIQGILSFHGAFSSANEELAFWINAYNALTLDIVIDHYPIEASTVRSLVFPRNSIRQIDGVWDRYRFRFLVIDREVSLNEIEHDILRKRFDEPRIHAAIVCASVGCPPLRREPYGGAHLGEELGAQFERFLAAGACRIDRERGVVHLSSIFDWFADDFAARAGTDPIRRSNERHPGSDERIPDAGDRTPVPDNRIPGLDAKTSSVLRYLAGYLSPDDREYVVAGGYRVAYLPYDWTLNDQDSSAGSSDGKEEQ